jgi:protein gp37
VADSSNISWTDHTFNPWVGCQRVSQGCVHCYAETLLTKRQGRDVWGSKDKRQRTTAPIWRRPARWNREAAEARRPFRVFCSSLADVFEDAPGPNEWREDVWAIIRATPWLDYQLLTKRPENIAAMLPADWGEGWPNVWLGTSIEDRRVVERARVLAAVPAIVHFISYEPAIGPVFYDDVVAGTSQGMWSDEKAWPPANNELDLTGIEWLIAGGESGPGHRPMDLEWAHVARLRCEAAGVAFWFKQVSGARPGGGEDALGQVYHAFPAAWDRADLATHPVYAEQAGALL